jgi:hypothetical protein
VKLSQVRKAFWLRRLSERSHLFLTSVKKPHRLGSLPETAK